MRALLLLKERGALCNADGTPGIKLVYIDPPFASAQEFKSSEGERAYRDKLETAKYLEFMRQRLILIRELLSDDGSIYVHLDYRMNSYIRVLMDEIFGKENFRNEIVWCYPPGGRAPKFGFHRKHDSILFYGKSDKGVLNHPYTEIPESTKKTFRKADKDGRLYKVYPGGRTYLDEIPGRPVPSWWVDIVSLGQATSSKENIDYPTQKPSALLKRIIEASSNEGDLVADFFAGSGVTCEVAGKLNRRWIGGDCGKLSMYKMQKRLLDFNEGLMTSKRKSFAVYNSGLYDASSLSKMSPDQWKEFSLQVFKCEDEPHEIGKIQMDGYKNGSSVIVLGQEDTARVTEDYIKELHGRIGKKAGENVYIIAPWSRFGFMQDWVEIRKVRYHALRIPCLNKPNFSPLSQPASQSEINQLVQSGEFSFIHRPEVQFSSGIKGGNGYVKLTKFQDMENRGDVSEKFGAFAMLMIDCDYKPSGRDEEASAFHVGEVFFADEISKNWTASFPANRIGDHLMLIFVDKYGNEARELISKPKFMRG